LTQETIMSAPTADFLDPETSGKPYEAYAQLRRDAPVYRDPRTGFYIVTRYDDVRAVLLDTENYSSERWQTDAKTQVLGERQQRMRELYQSKGWLPAPTLAGYDDPRHREIREVFTKAFRAGRIKQLDSFVESTAKELVADFATKGECELVKALAVPLPLIVIGQQMGARREDIWQIKAWTDAWVQRLGMMQTEDEERWSALQEIEAQHYFQKIYERLRKEPDDTVLSDLINTPMGGRTLNDNELHAHMMADTFVGGSETTTNAISGGVWLLCQFPEQYAKLNAEPDKYLRTFIEEVLRLESPVQGLFRVATREIELHGVKIPRGATVNARYAAANRDPEHFENPDQLDLERKNAATHLAFGTGVHHCLGAPLARRELHWAFAALFERVTDIRLAPGKNDFAIAPNYCLRALKQLHIAFTPR
jgi:cytochrome P450